MQYETNKYLFSKYSHRISHIVLDDGKLMDPTTAGGVWNNEYTSRNHVNDALVSIGASDDDIILLCDVDEIPSIDAIAIVRALQSHTQTIDRDGQR